MKWECARLGWRKGLEGGDGCVARGTGTLHVLLWELDGWMVGRGDCLVVVGMCVFEVHAWLEIFLFFFSGVSFS
jgi:hypothetical protein